MGPRAAEGGGTPRHTGAVAQRLTLTTAATTQPAVYPPCSTSPPCNSCGRGSAFSPTLIFGRRSGPKPPPEGRAKAAADRDFTGIGACLASARSRHAASGVSIRRAVPPPRDRPRDRQRSGVSWGGRHTRGGRLPPARALFIHTSFFSFLPVSYILLYHNMEINIRAERVRQRVRSVAVRLYALHESTCPAGTKNPVSA